MQTEAPWNIEALATDSDGAFKAGDIGVGYQIGWGLQDGERKMRMEITWPSGATNNVFWPNAEWYAGKPQQVDVPSMDEVPTLTRADSGYQGPAPGLETIDEVNAIGPWTEVKPKMDQVFAPQQADVQEDDMSSQVNDWSREVSPPELNNEGMKQFFSIPEPREVAPANRDQVLAARYGW